MKATDYIAKTLFDHGIDTVFLIQGAANSDLLDSIARTEGMRYVCPMHEQGGGFAAEGWAKVTGRPGCMIATSGPGGQNLVTPIANCYYDSVPAIFITGQVNSRFMMDNPGVRQVGFQEWPASQVLEPITKGTWTVKNVEALPGILDYALWLCQEGRPGPVHIDIPIDIQRQNIPSKFLRVPVADPSYAYGLSSDLRRVMQQKAQAQTQEVYDLIKKAHRPLFLVGGGAYRARAIVKDMITVLSVPAAVTWNAMDVVPSDMSLYAGQVGTYGGVGRNFAIQNCDLLIAVGSRISGRITGGNLQSFARGAKKVYVDIDPVMAHEANQQVPADISICQDAGQFCAGLTKLCIKDDGSILHTPLEWIEDVQVWRGRYDPVSAAPPVTLYHSLRAVSNRLADTDAVVIGDCGGNIVALNHSFQVRGDQRYITNNGNSPMGFSVAAAIGAAFAQPDRLIVAVIGDGGLMMNLQELQTIKNYQLPIKILLINNECYGISRAFQDTHFQGRHTGTGPDGYQPPRNFANIAQAFGIPLYQTSPGDSVEHIMVTEWLKEPKAAMLELSVPGFCTYEPAIKGWNTPIEDMTPLLPREEFRGNMLVDPLPGWETGNY